VGLRSKWGRGVGVVRVVGGFEEFVGRGVQYVERGLGVVGE
jgi:hypothetical protein